MTSLKKYVYDIRNIARAGGITDDERIAYRQVAEWIRQYRSLWLVQDQAKNRTISDNVSQDLGCVEMERVDKAECCTAEEGCMILKSVLAIPTPIDYQQWDGLTYVGDISKQHGFEPSVAVRAYWDQFNKYTAKVPKYYYHQGHIYITVKQFIKYLNVKGVFEDPTDAARFATCDGDPCYTDDMSYPITGKMFAFIKEQIMRKELGMSLQTITDLDNNAQGSTGGSIAKS